MSRAASITELEIHTFIKLCNQGMKRSVAAKEIGVPIPTLRSACKRLGIPWPGRTLLKEQIKEFEPQILAGTISQHQLAKELGCTQPRVSALFKELGYPSLPKGRAPLDPEAQSNRDDLCELAIEYIEKHGGSINNAVRKLELPESFRLFISAYGKAVDFDFERYRFAHRRYGHWLTLPGKAIPYSTMDYRLQAECTKCGTVHTVQLVNLKSGSSTQCRACAFAERKGEPRSKQCRCVETGEIIPSIRKLSIRTGVPYSSVEYRLNGGGFQHDGFTYVLA